MSDTLRAGLIGLGAMGRNHARVLSSMPGIDLVVIADPSGDPAGKAPAPVVPSVTDAVAIGLDLAVVAAPTSLHLQIGRTLADAGVPTLIEKPLAASVDEALDLAEVFERRGVLGCVGHIERFNPAIRALRQRLEHGELGDIYQVTTRRIGPFPARIADVGVILDLATHDIDLTTWVTGEDFANVSARTAHKSGRRHEDLVSVTGQLADRTVTSHTVNWLSPFKERCTIVTGSRGAFFADTLTADLTFHANAQVDSSWDALTQFRGVAQGDRITFAMDKPEPLAVELDAFRRAVSGESSDIVTLADGVRIVAVAESMLESARSGKTVEVRVDYRSSAMV